MKPDAFPVGRARAVRLAPLALLALLGGACGPPADPATETAAERPEPAPHRIALVDGWRLAAAADVDGAGDEVSRTGFPDGGWTAARIPNTVLGALVEAGEVEDPYFGRNLEAISADRFAGPWWHRTSFDVGPETAGDRFAIELDGVNYRAEVWLNGHRLAGEEELVGAYRRFSLDATGAVRAGENVLAIRVAPPRPGDFTVGFVDWNPTAPDRNMGLFRGVFLRRTGPVAVEDLRVVTDVDLETLDAARVTIGYRLENRDEASRAGTVRIEIDGIGSLEAPFSLAGGEVLDVELGPESHPVLAVDSPRLWWPHTMGEPHLHDLRLQATVDGAVSDATSLSFGIREVSDHVGPHGHRGYRVNGRDVLVRGGGWVDDLMLMEDPEKVEAQVRYAVHMNLNTLRLEGFWGSGPLLYDLADRYGLLVMVGWSCQWEWEEYLGSEVDEFGGIRTDEQIDLVARSLVDQVVWLRNHPSILVWVLASDMLPRPKLEERYLGDLDLHDPTRPVLAACSVRESEVSGPTGVKMNGPYDWVPPIYWFVDRERGGAFGFNTETGPGPQPPPLESVERMIPAENLWPIDEMWEYHCGRHQFGTLDRYAEALERRYGPSDGVGEFLRKSQIASYEAMRAMFEAFAVRRPETTGIIQWMLNSAWPEMYWQLYDWYLMPNGAFYATRSAFEPLNLVLDPATLEVSAVSLSPDDAAGLRAEIRVLDTASTVLLEEEHAVDLPAGAVRALTTLPPAASGAGVRFVDLRLRTASGEVTGRGLYWLPETPDVLAPEESTWYVTPTKTYADLSALDSLPPAEVAVTAKGVGTAADGEARWEIELANRSDRLAFGLEIRILDPATGRSILPVFLDDNYVGLLPGETRTIGARFRAPAEPPRVVVAGWNVPEVEATPAIAD